MGKIINRAGERNCNNEGIKMWILKYINSNNIIVQFEDGYIVKTKYVNFMVGNIKNPYYKSVYGVGYIGDGKYKTVEGGKHTRIYRSWNAMLRRCYNDKFHEKSPEYRNCTVCREWLNFQNFAEWYDNNYYEVKDKRMELDKDILYMGNKIYSPYTSVFAPQEINLMFRSGEIPKRSKILSIAEKYKDTIPDRLYEALLEYTE